MAIHGDKSQLLESLSLTARCQNNYQLISNIRQVSIQASILELSLLITMDKQHVMGRNSGLTVEQVEAVLSHKLRLQCTNVFAQLPWQRKSSAEKCASREVPLSSTVTRRGSLMHLQGYTHITDLFYSIHLTTNLKATSEWQNLTIFNFFSAAENSSRKVLQKIYGLEVWKSEIRKKNTRHR